MGSLAEAGVAVGIFIGVFGFALSVSQFFYGRKWNKLQLEREKELLEEQHKREEALLEEQRKREEILLAEQLRREEEKDRELARLRRLEDMKLIFLDKDISRDIRKPFFEEFVRLGGNGLYARMWLEEGAKLGEV
jgi:hypothetical protein